MRFVLYFSLKFLLLLEFVDATDNANCIEESSGRPGICSNLLECQSMINEFKKDRSKPLTICNKDSRKICCPLSVSSTTEKVEEEAVKVLNKISTEDFSTPVKTSTSQINRSKFFNSSNVKFY